MKLHSHREPRPNKFLAKEMLVSPEAEAELRFDPDKEIDGPTWEMILGLIEEPVTDDGENLPDLWKIINAATALVIAGENPERQTQVRMSIERVMPPAELVEKIRADFQITPKHYKNDPRLLESIRLLGGDYITVYAEVADLINLPEELDEKQNFYYKLEIPYLAHFLLVEPKPDLGPLFLRAPELVVRMSQLVEDVGDEQAEIIDELGRMRLADPQRFLETPITKAARQKIIGCTRHSIEIFKEGISFDTELFYIAQAIIVLAHDFKVTPNGVSIKIHGTSRNFKTARLPDRSIT